jgi:hypothetical protein
MKSGLIFIVMVLLALTSMSEPVPVRLACDISGVSVTGAEWRVSGRIYDNTVVGFSGLDVRTGFILACESEYGDVDLYRVSNIVTQDAINLTLIVAYVADGTNSTPRIGAPTFGQAALSETFGTNGVPLTSYFGQAAVSPYLRDAMAAVALKRLANSSGGGGGTTNSGSGLVLTNSFAEYQLEMDEYGDLCLRRTR